MAAELLAEVRRFGLGLGEPLLGFVKLSLARRQHRGYAVRLMILPRGGARRSFLLGRLCRGQASQPLGRLLLLFEQVPLPPGQFFIALGELFTKSGQFFLACGQLFAAGGQFSFAFAEPEADGPPLRLELGRPGVQFGLAIVQFLLPAAKMSGQLIGLEANLFGSRCVRHRFGRRHRQLRGRNLDFMRAIDSLRGRPDRSSHGKTSHADPPSPAGQAIQTWSCLKRGPGQLVNRRNTIRVIGKVFLDHYIGTQSG